MNGFSRGGYIPFAPEYRTAYWHKDHWSLSEKHNAPGMACDRILTKTEVQGWSHIV